jgi:hypothetical protein
MDSTRLTSEGGHGDASTDFTMLGFGIAISHAERNRPALRTLVCVAGAHNANDSLEKNLNPSPDLRLPRLASSRRTAV